MRRTGLVTVAVLLAAFAPSGSAGAAPAAPATAKVPRPAHVVVVMEENHSYDDVIGNPQAPYLNTLANAGASFTHSFAVTHPSQPNYVALFSGATRKLTDDSCPHTFGRSANLGSELLGAGDTFVGYSESMPSPGYTGCGSGLYARKHNPWSDFPATVPAASNQPLTAFPTSFDQLPSVSFVIPNLADDMHDGTVAAGDSWLRTHLGAYVTWANTHNSLLIVTWDEDDNSMDNQIPTIFVGQHVTPGRYPEQVTHYRVLRTIENAFDLGYVGNSAKVPPVTDCWR